MIKEIYKMPLTGNGTSISMTGNPVSGCQKTFLGFPGRLTLSCKKAHPHPSPCISYL